MPDLDNSFEVRWSLSELENIVYDFINSNELPKEFNEPIPGSKHQQESPFKDVSKEDLMKVVQVGKSGSSSDKEPLPNLIREYILHDRGNSLFWESLSATCPRQCKRARRSRNFSSSMKMKRSSRSATRVATNKSESRAKISQRLRSSTSSRTKT